MSKLAIAFYNLENLFDTLNDPDIADQDFTPQGKMKWDQSRYNKKLRKLAEVISKIGAEEAQSLPALVGVAEVENRKVLDDLTGHEILKKAGYQFVHHDSPDERGIDTALLYRKSAFEVLESQSHSLYIENEEGKQDFTRDILYVFGKLEGVETHILVNHWPSRGEGVEISEPKRIAAAKKNREIIEEIKSRDPDARIIVMGDLNDDPHSESVRNHLVKTDLYNPMVFLHTRYEGSLTHKSNWHLFDQIILSPNWIRAHTNPLVYLKSDIYNDYYLTEYEGTYKGNPFRTYAGDSYLGGYSDHFPVYVILESKLQSDMNR